MRALIWVLGLFAVAVVLVTAARYNNGYVLVVLPPWRAELSLDLAIVLVLGAFLIAYVVVRTVVITATMPCGAPLYGTCSSCVPVSWPNSTPDMWWLVPLPPDEKVRSPGLARAIAITSAGELAGLVIGTTMTFETPPISMIGAMSFSES